MFYHTYNTEAFILGGFPTGESSRYVYLFTKDLGLVVAHAQGTRKISSKLRYALDDLSNSRVSLVRGKNTWRLTNAAPQKHFFTVFRAEKEKLQATANILFTVKQLIAGEEANDRLYEIIKRGLAFFEAESFEKENIKNAEAIFMLRILDSLGYFGDHDLLGEFVADESWSHELIQKMEAKRKKAIISINSSLKESHL